MSPGVVVKVTQEPRFNRRLENEASSLAILAQEAAERLAPAPLFTGYAGGLFLLGQERVVGEPFRDVSNGEPTCAVAQLVVAELIRLAQRTARQESNLPAELDQTFTVLLQAYEKLHRPPTSRLEYLHRQVEALSEIDAPLVFLHGDPTTFNILVRPDSTIALVDWENGERNGLPLWDLFYFINAYAAWSANRKGHRYSAIHGEHTFFGPSPYHQMLQGAVTRSLSALNLPSEASIPLLALFLTQLTLREATRSRHPRLGTYARLLARMADKQPSKLAVTRPERGANLTSSGG